MDNKIQIEKKQIDLKDISIEKLQKISDIENKYELQTCCGNSRTDARLLNFISKVLVLTIVLLFSCIQVSRDDENTNIYINLIVMILSIMVPSPSLKQNK